MKHIKAFRKEEYGWFIDLEDIDASVAIDLQTGDILLNEGQGNDCFDGAVILRQSFIGISLEEMSEAEFQVILKFGKERTHSLGVTSQKIPAEMWIRDVASIMASATPAAKPTVVDPATKTPRDPLPEDLEDEYGHLVQYLAKKVWYSCSPEQRRLYDLKDLVQIGWIGFLQAWERFDPSRGVRPSTFLTYRVLGAIRDSLRATDPLSQARRQQYREVEYIRKQLRQHHGREVTLGEIATALGVLQDEINTLLRDAESESVPLDVGPAPASSSNDPETEALHRTRHENLWQCLRTLEARQYQLILLRYFETPPPTLQAIADILGLPLSTVAGQLQQAHTRLRPCLRAKGWDVQE